LNPLAQDTHFFATLQNPKTERFTKGRVYLPYGLETRRMIMAIPERDPAYTTTNNTERTVYTRESNGTGWFVGIIVVLALLAIGYLVFSANSGPSTTNTTVNNTPAVTAPADTPATPAPMTEAPAATPAAPNAMAPATTDTMAPATPAPSTDTAPATPAAPAAEPATPAVPAQ